MTNTRFSKFKNTFARHLGKALAFAMILTLSGCGQNAGSTKDSEPAIEKETVKEPETDTGSSAGVTSGLDSLSNTLVKYSHTSGFYDDPITLELTAATADKLFYTTDGSDPRTSETAVEYSEPLTLGDRSNDKNVVSAVDPDLFDTAHAKYQNGNIVSYAKAPSDTAVDKCHVVKSALLTGDGKWSDVYCGTYFIGTAESHIEGLPKLLEAGGESLALISITTDYDNLFDYETGIYMKGSLFEESWKEYIENGGAHTDDAGRKLLANYSARGREWERECHIEMLECSDSAVQSVISQSCGIRIQGNYSRSDLQKSFRLTAREEYGDKRFRYNIFGESSPSSYKSVVLRNGGNSAFGAKFNDTFWQSLARDADLDISTQMSRPAVVYLNGEYWGLYVLQEDYSSEYFEDHYDVDSDDIILYKGDAETIDIGYKLDIGEIPSDAEEQSDRYYYLPLINFFETHEDLTDAESYSEFCTLVDPDSVRDYFAFETYINNKWDWPGKNWSMWKSNTVIPGNEYNDGRWRFCLFDIEFGGISGSGDSGTNTIKEDNYMPYGLLDRDTKNIAVLCFAYLMTNREFRNDFYEKLRDLDSGVMVFNNANGRLSEFIDMYEPLFDQFFRRYPDSGSTDEAMNNKYYASAACIRLFLFDRSVHIEEIIKYCESTE
ncbi:MAG: CotH kinase family protein, partial [Lachnospiraceae bacterium]|nr:CotH kinase family protein [Lachnospiraceae bacterium]